MQRLFVGLAAALTLTCAPAPAPSPARPNIILILTDDQGWGDIGVHGNDRIRTPNLDRLAAESLEFTNFYVEAVCAPTRAGLMTGRYFYRSGVIHTSRGGAKMHGGELTLAEMLRDAGYRTGLFGKWHLGDNYPMRPQDQGFEQTLWHKSGGINQAPDRPNDYFDPYLWRNGEKIQAQGYCTDVFFDAAMEFIAQADERPFFVYLPTNAPHTPLWVAEEYWKPYADEGLDETTAKVYGMVENIDDNFARLDARLGELGLREDTLVVLISDNGPQQVRYTAGLRGRKSMAYEGGIRALSFWRRPAVLAAGTKIDRIAAHIDVAPTLLEIAGVASPRQLDGLSLVPLLAGRTADWPERTLFFQVHRGLTPKPFQNAAVRTDRYKLVGAGDSFTDEDWNRSDDPPLELFDLAEDPAESNDLSGELPDILADLRSRYEAWFADVASTRRFTPGIIHLGADQENPALLCRYQDSTFVDGAPTTWSVDIERAGPYELSINRGGDLSAGTLFVELNGEASSRSVGAGESAVVVELPAGPAKLGVWFVPARGRREIITDNGTLGDVLVRRIDP